MVEKRGWGVVTTGGVAVQVRPSLVLISEVYWRQYGFTLDGFEGFEDDLYSYGITAGVGWRP